MSKLTPWYPPEIKPVRKGAWMTTFVPGFEGFSYWDGLKWSHEYDDIATLMKYRDITEYAVQSKSWRGLAAEPKGEKS